MSSNGGIGPDGKVHCNHGEEAARHKSNNPKHPNRVFFCCKRSRDEARCGFWRWADDLLPSETVVHAPSSSPQSPSKGGARSSGRPTPSPYPHSPPKHPSSPTSPSETANRRSRKRLEDIEAGLKQREVDLSPVRRGGPSGEPCTPPPIAPTIPQPPSPVPTEVDPIEVKVKPRKTYSFLGLHDSPEPVVSVVKDEGRPSTPKKRRTLSQPASSSGGGLLLTPPQSTQRITDFDQTMSLSVATRGRKGKEREGAPVRTEDRDGFTSGEQSEDSLPVFTPSDDVTGVSVSPTPADNVLDYSDGMKARVKALLEYMDSFDITRAAKFLQTVERQKIQYEYRDKSQKKRIEELIAERDKLAAEVACLKEALSSEDRHPISLKDLDSV